MTTVENAEGEELGLARTAMSVWALLLAVGLLMMGRGLQGSLIGVRADLEGFATITTGVIISAYYAGFLIGSNLIPRLLSNVGHIRAFSGLASLASTAALVHVLFVNPASWMIMRLITGLCLSGMYVVNESWLNERATNANRGRLLGIYMVVSMGSMGLGQLLLGTADPNSFELFVFSSLLISLAIVPVALTRIPAPHIKIADKLRLADMIRTAPLAAVGGVFSGAGSGALVGIGAIFANKIGLAPSQIGLLLAAPFLGAILFQWPLGYLSDHVPRRQVILGAATVGALVAWWGTSLGEGPALFVAMGLYGAVIFPLYSLSVSHLNDVIPYGQMVAASAGFMILNGSGAIVGPLVAAGMIVLLGPSGYWWTLMGMLAPIALFTLYRVIRVTAPRQRDFLNVSSRGTGLLTYVARPRRKNGVPAKGSTPRTSTGGVVADPTDADPHP